MNNKPFDYIEEAHLTASPHFHGEKVPLAHFGEVLKQAIEALQALDKVKKSLFYGRELPISNISGNNRDLFGERRILEEGEKVSS